MRRKITYDFVKQSFEMEGYQLLSKEYIRSDKHLYYTCNVGHDGKITWDCWKQGHRCLICAGQKQPSILEIRDVFENEGYLLISSVYINAHRKLEFVCPNGHRYHITWRHWQNGRRCVYCSKRPPIIMEEVKRLFKKENYDLLSTEYINSQHKLVYTCSIGHLHSMSWNSWQRRVRCPTCAIIKKSGPGHPNWNGGSSFEPYCPIWKDKEYKNDIKERDSYICQNFMCGSKENLQIHHINYDKKDCCPSNLITLCRSCNTKANKDRGWHQSFYTEINKHNKNKHLARIAQR